MFQGAPLPLHPKGHWGWEAMGRRALGVTAAGTAAEWRGAGVADWPLASASSDMIGWRRILPSHTLDAARSH